MKFISIIGARPQFIKAASISRELRTRHQEVLVHTGQHYDSNMSGIFFDELDIPKPDVNLGVGSLPHAAQTGEMLARIEQIIFAEEPDWVLVYGDTNSTLAGALAAVKLRRRVAHIEAGLRSYNRSMPEEINRVLTDHISDLLFCPSQVAVDNLAGEGILNGVHLVGDVMLDMLQTAIQRAKTQSNILEKLGLEEKNYLLATIHRAENTDDLDRLAEILAGLTSLDELVVIPLHPRTRKALQISGLIDPSPQNGENIYWMNIYWIEPVGYVDMVRLQQAARMILTDSGGIQKEAYWLQVPCLTLREETEWIETIDAGWNILVGASKEAIIENVRSFMPPGKHPELYGDGNTAQRCVDLLTVSKN